MWVLDLIVKGWRILLVFIVWVGVGWKYEDVRKAHHLWVNTMFVKIIYRNRFSVWICDMKWIFIDICAELKCIQKGNINTQLSSHTNQRCDKKKLWWYLKNVFCIHRISKTLFFDMVRNICGLVSNGCRILRIAISTNFLYTHP